MRHLVARVVVSATAVVLGLGLFLQFSPRPLAAPEAAPAGTSSPARLDVDAAVTSIAAQSTGDGLSVVATPQGAHLRAAFQQLQADVTAEGLSLGSTAPRGGALTLRADRLGRGRALRPLARAGTVAVHDSVATFTRPGLHEEFSTGIDGLQQDFVVAERPTGEGALTVELAMTGATAEQSKARNGATLTLAGSGRELAYSRLHVVDARGTVLTARLDVLASNRLAIAVDDATAVYPVRIDPTFSDAHWVSLNGDVAGVDAGVRASVTDAAGNVYVGGNFLLAGSTVVNRIAKWDPTTSTWSGLGTGMNGLVSALALSSDGSLYAVGSFTTAGGVPANRVARWDPVTSTWSALGAGTNLAATAVAVDGSGSVYVGGAGTFGNATPGTVRIAKWNGTTWSPLGPGLNGVPSAMVFDASGNLYVGGGFTATQGNAVALSRVAKWTPSTSTWSALGSGVSFSITATPGVAALAIDSSGNLFVGGGFDTAGGVSASRIAMWNGTSWSALGSGFNSTANALAFDSSGTLYAGGFFSTAGGVSTGTVARWDGSSWSAAGAGPGVVTYTLAANGTDVYAGGDFASVGFVSAPFIARFSGSTSQWSSLGGGTDGQVYAVTTMGSDLYVGGSFTRIGGIAAKNIARWNGTNWSAVGPGLNAYVRALAVVGGNLYAGGTFTATADGTVATKLIGRWNGSSWSVLSGGAYDTPAGFGFTHIGALAVMGTDLYAGGLRVNRLGGVVTGNLAKFDTILGTWAPVDAGFLPTFLEALTVSGTDLYVGGAFATAGGITVNNIAKWSTSTHTWSGFGPGLNNRVWALATIGTDVYAGGIFGATADNSVPLVRIAKWDGTAWSAMGSGAPNNSVNAFAVSGTDLYVGGSFATAGGLATPNIAKWNGTAWSAMGTGINGTVNALLHDASGHLFVGGLFGVAGTTVSPMIVQATLDPPPTAVAGIDQSIDATSGAGATATLDGSASSDPENDPLTYTWRDAASTIVGTTAVVSPTVPFGTHTYTLTVLDSHGNTASDSVVVTVQDHFTITVTTPPVISATYTFGQQVPAAYSCTDSAGLIASCVGPVANGADIDTSSLGAHTFEVTATNTRGDMSSLSTAYSVVQGGSTTVVTCPPSVTYNGSAQTPCTVSVTGAGGSSLTPAATHASNTDVGTATASYTFAGDANHSGSSASASFEITQAELTVTANDKARADLGLNPLFDGTIVGAAAGDGITATYASTTTTVPGTYPIVPTLVDPAGRLGNYTVTVNNGSLTVFDTQPPALTVPSGLTAEAVDSAGALVVFDELVSAFDAASGPAAVSCVPASGSTFPLGSSDVTCTAQDAAGNPGSATFSLLVQDTTPPTLEASDVSAIATDQAGVVVTYDPIGHDTVSGDVASVCSPTSGSTFPVGSTSVSCTATDAAGNVSASAVFQVTVLDGVAPVLTVPTLAPAEATSAAGAAVSFAVTATDNIDQVITPTCSPLSGAFFPIGATLVGCTANDAAGNGGSATFTVTVEDTTPPELTMPSVVTATATSGTSAVGLYSATATDLVDGALTPSCAPASGSSFPIGNTTVECTVADAAGNTAVGSFTMTVNDGIAPVLVVSPAGDQTVEATSGTGAVVTFTVTATDNFATGLVPTCAPLSGSTFSLGATSVTCQAQDQQGNVGLASFTVTVVDTTPPVLTLPPSVTAAATGAAGVAVTFATSAQDSVDGASAVTCTPASGSTFPAGTTTVACSAADSRGNTRSGSFVVTVTLAQSGIEKFVAFSRDSTVLRSGATVTSGDVGANERRRHTHRNENDDNDDGDRTEVTVRVGQRAVMQQASSRVVGDTVRLLNRSSVYNVVDNFLINRRGTVLGSVTSPMAIPYLTMPAFPVVTPGTVAKEVPKNGTLTLGPGAYGNVHVSKGGTLILTGGLYQMRSLDVDQNATVRFRGATELRIKTELSTAAKARLILDQQVPGLGASQIVIYVEGADSSCSHTDGDDDDDHGQAAVHIGQSNVVQANIYAATGTVWLKSKTQATGAFIGEHVRIGQNVTLTLDSAF